MIDSLIEGLKESAQVFMIKIFQEDSSFGEVFKVKKTLLGQRFFGITIQNLQGILSLWFANNHCENSLLALELILPDLNKQKITGFPIVLSTGFNFEYTVETT